MNDDHVSTITSLKAELDRLHAELADLKSMPCDSDYANKWLNENAPHDVLRHLWAWRNISIQGLTSHKLEISRLHAELDAAKKGIHARDVERTISEGYVKMLGNAQLRWPKPGVDSTPKEPGWYWWRRRRGSLVFPARVQKLPDNILWAHIGILIESNVNNIDGEWAGPHHEPLEPEGDK